MRLKAILFDVDGTLAETEEAHRQAFNRAFREAGCDWEWSREDYRELLLVAGGKERIRAFAARIGETISDHEVASMHRRKNALYAEAVAAGQVVLRPGVAALIDTARTVGIKLAIATTTSRDNLIALLDRCLGANAMASFDAVATGEDVAAKKPDPEVYRIALARLALPASACVAIEDSRNGLLAATRAGIATIVTPAIYTDHERFDEAAVVRPNLQGITLSDLDAALRTRVS